MTRNAIARSLAATAVLASGIIGLPAVADPTTAAARFVGSVLVAPVATSAGTATIGSPDVAAEQFVGTVMARRAGQVAAPLATASSAGEAAETFVQRVMARGSAV